MKSGNTTSATRNTVENFYRALADRNLEEVANQFSNNLDWYIPGEKSIAPWLGARRNREEVKMFFHTLLENIESREFSIHHIFADDEFAVVTGTFTSIMLKTGKLYVSDFSAHFTVKDNQIVYYRFLEDSNALVKALT